MRPVKIQALKQKRPSGEWFFVWLVETEKPLQSWMTLETQLKMASKLLSHRQLFFGMSHPRELINSFFSQHILRWFRVPLFLTQPKAITSYQHRGKQRLQLWSPHLERKEDTAVSKKGYETTLTISYQQKCVMLPGLHWEYSIPPRFVLAFQLFAHADGRWNDLVINQIFLGWVVIIYIPFLIGKGLSCERYELRHDSIFH